MELCIVFAFSFCSVRQLLRNVLSAALLQQSSQCPLELLIVGRSSGPWPLRPATCPAMFRLDVPLVELKLDALLRKHVTGRSQATGTFAQDESGQAPILRHHDIARARPVDDGKVGRIRPVAYRYMFYAVLVARTDVVVKRRHRYEPIPVLPLQRAQYVHRPARASIDVDEDVNAAVI